MMITTSDSMQEFVQFSVLRQREVNISDS